MHCGILRNRTVDMEIKPCPFCGGKAEFVVIPGDDIIMCCSSCHASTEKYFWALEHAVKAWNKRRIVDDHFSVTEDIKIEDFLVKGIKKVLFSKYDWNGTPDGGNYLLCSGAVIVTNEEILLIGEEGEYLTYEEIINYGYDYYVDMLGEDYKEFEFVKSRYKDNRLISIELKAGEKKVIISSCYDENCIIVFK